MVKVEIESRGVVDVAIYEGTQGLGTSLPLPYKGPHVRETCTDQEVISQLS